MTKDPLLSHLAAIVGEQHVVADEERLAPHLVEPRGKWRGAAVGLVRPGTTKEVAEVVKLCAARGVSIVPQGGNTGLVGGQTPDLSGAQLIVSTTRLKRVREVDVVGDVMVLEAGVTLKEAQDAAEAHGRLFPLSLASEGSCTVGGNLSSNAGGVHVLAYGNARELTRGVEVVLADGRVVNALSKLRKDNTGYDLKDLFVGAEGTLGIITAASLRLFPAPKAHATAFIGLRNPDAAVDLFRRAQDAFGLDVTAFELIPRLGIEFVLRHIPGNRDPLADRHPWYVLMEVSSTSRATLEDDVGELLGAAIEAGVATDAAIATSLQQRAQFWRMRESLSESQAPEGVSIKHDVSVAVADVPRLLAETTADLARAFPGARPFPFGHLGDGNVHFNISQPIGADPAEFRAQEDAIHALVHGAAAKLGGSIAAEHGVGQMKRDLLPQVKDPVALEVMRAIKRALDPQNLMNPGKVL